jgi:hypothetical protein
MKLKQGQIWKNETGYLKIVELERLSVQYKITQTAHTKDGSHHQATKKEFCRLIKGATEIIGQAE